MGILKIKMPVKVHNLMLFYAKCMLKQSYFNYYPVLLKQIKQNHSSAPFPFQLWPFPFLVNSCIQLGLRPGITHSKLFWVKRKKSQGKVLEVLIIVVLPQVQLKQL